MWNCSLLYLSVAMQANPKFSLLVWCSMTVFYAGVQCLQQRFFTYVTNTMNICFSPTCSFSIDTPLAGVWVKHKLQSLLLNHQSLLLKKSYLVSSCQIFAWFICDHLCVCVCVCVRERERERERETEQAYAQLWETVRYTHLFSLFPFFPQPGQQIDTLLSNTHFEWTWVFIPKGKSAQIQKWPTHGNSYI